MRLQIVTFTLIALTGCAAPKQQLAGGEKIIITTTRLPKSCVFSGQISGNSMGGGFKAATQDEAMNDLRNKALALDANFIHIETGAGNMFEWKILGNAFKCPEGTIPGQE